MTFFPTVSSLLAVYCWTVYDLNFFISQPDPNGTLILQHLFIDVSVSAQRMSSQPTKFVSGHLYYWGLMQSDNKVLDVIKPALHNLIKHPNQFVSVRHYSSHSKAVHRGNLRHTSFGIQKKSRGKS